MSRAELREQLIEMWAQLLERELRAALEGASRGRDDAPDVPADADEAGVFATGTAR